MNPYRAYQQQQSLTGWSRIDMLLALYDGAIERLDKAIALLNQGQDKAAEPLLIRVQLIVGALVSGMAENGTETQANLYRLYEFVLHSIRTGGLDNLRAAKNTLSTLREGFQGIRAEAVHLERNGTIPPMDVLRNVHATA
jgi:flagellar secretion chaperone FliS